MTGVDPLRVRRIFTALLLLAGFVIVLFRLFNLQVLQAGELALKAERQHEKAITIQGGRGTIYDRRGKVLAINLEVPSVFGVPTSLDDPTPVARELGRVLHVRPDEIEKKLKKERSFVWIARKVDPEQGRRLQRMPLEGIGLVLEGRRYYPKGTLLSHVIGFAGMDGEGLEGIERRYDSYLRGEKQMVVLQRDALGRTVFPKGFTEQGPSSGHSVTLTIDETIQYIAEKELEEAVTASRAKGGTIIVMEPRTGAVLAMALVPTFDPNSLGSLYADRWRNRAVTDVYEPGSTFKVLLAAAALEDKVMEPQTILFGERGSMTVANTVIHDHDPSGWMTFAQVLERSSNIGAVKTALALGPHRLSRVLRAFGFGERSEIDLPGEATGLVRDSRSWGHRSLASIAMGQEIGVTPVQLATALSAVANGGWLMKPHVVAEIRDGKGQAVFQASSQVRRQPISAGTAQKLTRILEGAVSRGTGKSAAVSGYRVAGKTGTAQKVDPRTGTYSTTLFIGSFVGFVPAEDPRLCILVVIDEPQTEAWGGVVAAPVFRRVAEQVLPYLGVAPQEPVRVALAEGDSIGVRRAGRAGP